MRKPILEIRCSDSLTPEQHDIIYGWIREAFTDYEPIVLDSGMSAHIHDEAILNELREIKQILNKPDNVAEEIARSMGMVYVKNGKGGWDMVDINEQIRLIRSELMTDYQATHEAGGSKFE